MMVNMMIRHSILPN